MNINTLYIVIPAQAGIQQLNSPREAGQQTGFVRCAEYFYKLDSGLRRNDGVLA